MSATPASLTQGSLKVALVVGVSHSGSTMLDLTLGSHPNIVGVGEVFNFGRKWLSKIQAGLSMPCVCGADVSECELWGAVVARAAPGRAPEESIVAAYEEVTARFRELGPNDVMLDSSKKLASIELIRRLPDIDLRVLFIVRDVRGWVASALDRHGRLGQQSASWRRPWTRGMQVLRDARLRSPIVLARKWYEANHGYLAKLEELNVPFHIVPYERLCLETDEMLTEIADFLDVERHSSLSPADSGSHVVNGNNVRLDPERRSRLAYDSRWMRRLDVQIPYIVLPHVRRLNNRLVWGSSSG